MLSEKKPAENRFHSSLKITYNSINTKNVENLIDNKQQKQKLKKCQQNIKI